MDTKVSNAQRFLDAYASVENKMTAILKETKYVPFSQLLARCAEKNKIVSNNMETLREYHELRNAIVHMRGDQSEIIAEPCDSVTETIESIATQLNRDDCILNYAVHPVKTVKLEDSIKDAFETMEHLNTSKIPVYDENTYKGVLTNSMIAKYALEISNEGCVKDALSNDTDAKVLFLSKSANIQEAIKGFDKSIKEGKKLVAILITEHGNINEVPLGIITMADVPTILK